MTDVSPSHPAVAAVAPATRPPGSQQILGDFDLHERIGEGSSAVVYRALNRTFNGFVAVKVWREPLTESQRHTFIDECKLQWRLSDHPNIVRLYWADAPTGARPWLATELYESSLEQRTSREPALTCSEIFDYADDILAGLTALHSERLLHRDVKPANVLVKGGRAALGDLGITMHMDSWTRDQAAGTDAFLAPELVLGAPPTFRSDVFSAAVTIRSMFGDDIPPEIETILARSASHDPRDRPADAQELRQHLRVARAATEYRHGGAAAPASQGSPVWGGAPSAPTPAVHGWDGRAAAAPAVATPSGGPPANAAPGSPPRRAATRTRRMSVALAVVVWAFVFSVAAVVGFTAHQSASGSPRLIPLPAADARISSVGSSRGNRVVAPPPAIERCSTAIRKNPAWVCLSHATMSGSQLMLMYNSNFTPTRAASGRHLHIFTAQLNGDGTVTPADSSMGMQSRPTSTTGSWWTSYQAGSITIALSRPADSPKHRSLTKMDPFVCVRVATQQHGLVRDLHGGYRTGNCIRISS